MNQNGNVTGFRQLSSCDSVVHSREHARHDMFERAPLKQAKPCSMRISEACAPASTTLYCPMF